MEASAKLALKREGTELKGEAGAELDAAKIGAGGSVNVPIPILPGKVLSFGGEAEAKVGVGGKIEGAIGTKKIKFGIKGAFGVGFGFGGFIGIDDAPKAEGKGKK